MCKKMIEDLKENNNYDWYFRVRLIKTLRKCINSIEFEIVQSEIRRYVELTDEQKDYYYRILKKLNKGSNPKSML
jgi:hypothetical protein